MRKLLLLFIVSFSCINICSQNLTFLFQNDLPKDIHKYFTDQSVNDILIRDIELNPEILYWHLIYLNELVENKEMDNDKNGLNSIKKLAVQARLEKNNFLEEVIAAAGQNKSNEYKGKIIDILAPYIMNTTPAIIQNYKLPDFDTNRMCFVTAKFLSGDRKLSYNKEELYQLSIKKLESKYYSELKQKLSDMKNIQGNVTMEYLECLIKNWWLVKNNPVIANDLSSAIREFIDQEYSNRKLGSLAVTAGFGYTFNALWYSYDFSYPVMNKADPYSINGVSHFSETTNYLSFNLQAEYKVQLKELVSFLSYVNIGIGASMGVQPSVSYSNFSSFQQYNYINWSNKSALTFNADNIKIGNMKNYSIAGKISVPVIIFTPEFILHLGVLGGINYYKADVSYNYSYINVVYSYTYQDGYKTTYLQNDVNVPKTESISRRTLSITPIVGLNMYLLKNVLLEFTTSGYNFFSINAGVEF